MKRLNLNRKLQLIVTSFMMLILVIIFPAIFLYKDTHTKQYIEQNVLAQHEKIETSLSHDFYQINYTFLSFFSDEDIEKTFSSDSSQEMLDEKLQSPALPCHIQGIAISDGINVKKSSFFYNNFEFPNTISNEPLSLYETYNDNLILIKSLNSVEGLYGYYVIVAVPFTYFEPLFLSVALHSNSLFTDNPPVKYSYKERGNTLIVTSPMNTLNEQYGIILGITSEIDVSSFNSMLTLTLSLIMTATLLVFVISIFICSHYSKLITQPINDLSMKVSYFKVSNTEKKDKKKKLTSDDELHQLETSFDEMTERINTLIKKSEDEAEVRRKLELESLQMQINPHFLYNTLDAIVWMAKIKKETDIEQLVLSLARFFRIALHRGDKIITVKEELELTKHYLEIQKIRFPMRFDMVFDVDEKLTDYKTLKLILQPIVENSIKYGFSVTKENAMISISLKEEENDLTFVIKDNGQGFEVPLDILSTEHGEPLEKGGYGLFNVNERIRLEYGEKYGLKVESQVGKGTTVMVRIPKIDNADPLSSD